MKVTVARIYATEGEHVHAKIFKRLHDDEKVQVVTMFRGITGSGRSGKVRASTLLDMSIDLLVVIGFFNAPDKVMYTLEHLRDIVQPDHVLTFAADLT
jgi:PII-like signaling protein